MTAQQEAEKRYPQPTDKNGKLYHLHSLLATSECKSFTAGAQWEKEQTKDEIIALQEDIKYLERALYEAHNAGQFNQWS